MDRKYVISSEAGDGINGTSHAELAYAKAIVHRQYGITGRWQEVPGAPDSSQNAHEYLIDGESVAWIEYAVVYA